jgi:F-type H+-transporting ATPase subunit epsilon
MNKFDFKVITPEGVKLTSQLRSIVVRTVDGDIEILPHHMPLISPLANGIVTLDDLNSKKQCFCGKGIIKVTENDVTLLVSSFNTKEEIDLERAKRARLRALAHINGKEPSDDINRAQDALERAEYRIKLVLGGKIDG